MINDFREGQISTNAIKYFSKLKVEEQKEGDQIQLSDKTLKERKFIIEELIYTEENYIKDLNLVIEHVLSKFKMKFKEQEIENMFSNFEQLVEANQKFLDKLKYKIKLENEKYYSKEELELQNYYGNPYSKIFEIFVDDDIVSQFQHYKKYNNLYSISSQNREKICKSDNEYMSIIKEAGEEIFAKNQNKFQQIFQSNLNQYKKLIEEYQTNQNKAQKTQYQDLDMNRLKLKAAIEIADCMPMSVFQDLENLLVKPIQRLTKYNLIFNQLLKNSQQHPDQQNIVIMLKKFQQLNETINEEISKHNFQTTIAYFGIDQKGIDQNDIKWKQDEEIQYKVQKTKKWENCAMVCIKNTIYIKFENKSLKSEIIEFDLTTRFFESEKSKDDVEDSKKYKQFQIHHSRQQYEFQIIEFQYNIFIKKLEKSIEDFYQDQMQELFQKEESSQAWQTNNINFEIVGTEEYDVATINNYTVYIIKITTKDQDQDVFWKIYKSLEELVELQNVHQNLLQQNDQIKLGNWYNQHDNEFLIKNCENIQNYLKRIFLSKIFLEEDKIRKKILFKLGIPNNFYALTKMFGKNYDNRSIRQSMVNQNETEKYAQYIFELNQRYLEQLKKIKMIQETIQKTNEEQFIEEQVIEVQVPYSIYKIDEDYQLLQPKVKSVLDTIGINVKVGYLTKAIQTCEVIAHLLKLQEFHDFRLILLDTRGNKRVLENDQVFLQSLPKRLIKQSFMNKQFKQVQIQYQLYFQKYIFYPIEIESKLYKKDSIRLILLNDHFFKELKQYSLSVEQYVLIYALFIIIFQKNQKMSKEEFEIDTNDLDQLISFNIRKTQNNEFWKELTYPQIQILNENLKQICESQDQTYNYKENSIQYHARLTLAKFSFNYQYFGIQYFYVGIDMGSECHKFLLNKLYLLPNIFLGITYKEIKLLTPNDKVELISFSLSQITKIIVQPILLILQIKKVQKEQENPLSERNQRIKSIVSSSTKTNNQNDDSAYDQQDKIIQEDEKIEIQTPEAYRISQLINEYKELEKLRLRFS